MQRATLGARRVGQLGLIDDIWFQPRLRSIPEETFPTRASSFKKCFTRLGIVLKSVRVRAFELTHRVKSVRPHRKCVGLN
jgi:hypothetical protein